jgi:hypothetical protein
MSDERGPVIITEAELIEECKAADAAMGITPPADIDTSGMSEEETAALGMNEYPPESYERDAIEQLRDQAGRPVSGDVEVPMPAVEAPRGAVIAALEESTALVVTQANAITISDQDGYEGAGAFLTGTIKAVLAAIAETFDPIDEAQKAARKVTIAQRKRHEAPLIEAQKIIKAAMGVYVIEQRRIAAEAEAERFKVAREEAEAATLAEAARLEDAGHTEAAEEMITAPVVSAPPPEAPKADGVSARFVPKYRIIDRRKIGAAFMMPNEKKIGQTVRNMGADAAELVGGIEVYEEPVIAASAR